MKVAYLADNIVDAHLAKHLLEDAGVPAFVFGESLLGGAGELPLFGVLRVCVPEGYEESAEACLKVLARGSEAADDEDPETFGTVVRAT